MVSDSNWLQLLNVLSGILVNLEESLMLFSEVQPLNNDVPILSTLSGIEKLSSSFEFEKAALPIVLTDKGMFT